MSVANFRHTPDDVEMFNRIRGKFNLLIALQEMTGDHQCHRDSTSGDRTCLLTNIITIHSVVLRDFTEKLKYQKASIKSKGLAKVIRSDPLGTMNVCAIF